MNRFLVSLLVCTFGVYVTALIVTEPLQRAYQARESFTITDKALAPIYQEPNAAGNYRLTLAAYPAPVIDAVLIKEDRYFYYHPGVNPMSLLRIAKNSLQKEFNGGSSTLTQQLVKVLLATEQDRTALNKIKETLLAFALEIRYSKDTILTMYLNTVYMGNQAEGFAQASYVYFGKPIADLSASQITELVTTLSSPSTRNPWQSASTTQALMAEVLGSYQERDDSSTTGHTYHSAAGTDIKPLVDRRSGFVTTTIDTAVTDHIRGLTLTHTDATAPYGGTHAAVVVLTVPEMEVVSLVGSPDPFGKEAGDQLNMSIEPRPIGSTIKPFIYTKAFEQGARPYSLVHDREFKYLIGTGFPLYPKNYDGAYNGVVTLHEALANSLNTPSISLLDFIDIQIFYELLEEDMQFVPINPLESYAHGIALGGLEMDLLTLTHYFSSFPNDGVLKPIQLTETVFVPPQNAITEEVQLFAPEYVALTESILIDRASGAEQFGLKSSLTIPHQTVAVKTGTSRDFHDNWVVGYTPDYVVGVWVGNTQNQPMDGLAGSQGAGPLWRNIMEYMYTTPYNKNTAFTNESLVTYPFPEGSWSGLPEDQLEISRNIVLDQTLILHPHPHDTFLLEPKTQIVLRSDQVVQWSIDGVFMTSAQEHYWQPLKAGTYTVTAETDDATQSIAVVVTAEKSLTQ